MTKYRFLTAGALGALVLGLAAVPAQAQDDNQPGFSRGGNAERAERVADEPRQGGSWAQAREVRAEARSDGGERPAVSARQAPAPSEQRGNWGGAMRARTENPAERYERREAHTEAPPAAVAPSRNTGYGADRNVTHTTPRDRSYAADSRGSDWAAQRHAGDAAQQQHRSSGSWARPGDRHQGASGATGTSGWQRDPSYGARRPDWQHERRENAHRNDQRHDAGHYNNGHRDAGGNDHRDDNRYGQNHRRWDNRGWRNDNRYDWYGHRASNRSLFSLGRYYAPYRGYNYSRVSIGVRLGSPFYSSRYWINDPSQYRLPDVYGSYRWVRYYNDALLVDIYTGEVVDVIQNFFW